jgi:hypothetical protein
MSRKDIPASDANVDERRESSIDIMASWALEGMEPTPDVRGRIRAYVEGKMTTAEYIAEARARYVPVE